MNNILNSGAELLRGLDPARVNYPDKEIAIWLAIALVALISYKLLFSRNKYSQKYSGYFIPESYYRGSLSKLIDFLFKLILALGVALLITALADPFIPETKTETIVKESRERIDLIDASSSKGWLFKDTHKPAGQVGREAHLKFLKMRRGKNDRVSLWLFSTSATKVEDFIIDDDLYLAQVEDAPYVVVDASVPALPGVCDECGWLKIVVPEDRVKIVKGEGASNLDVGLQAVIKGFDEQGNKALKRKAVLIETDAAVERFPEAELLELKKRQIRPYFIYMEPNEDGEKRAGFAGDLVNAQKLKAEIEQYGGKFYDIQDEKSIMRAYEDIDRLESVELKDTYSVNKILFFQAFILLGILMVAMAVMLLLFIELSSVYP